MHLRNAKGLQNECLNICWENREKSAFGSIIHWNAKNWGASSLRGSGKQEFSGKRNLLLKSSKIKHAFNERQEKYQFTYIMAFRVEKTIIYIWVHARECRT